MVTKSLVTTRTRELSDAASKSLPANAKGVSHPTHVPAIVVNETADEAAIPDWVYRRFDMPEQNNKGALEHDGDHQ